MEYSKAEAKVVYFNNSDAILTRGFSWCNRAQQNYYDYGECGPNQISKCRGHNAYTDVCNVRGTGSYYCSFDLLTNAGL